MMVVDLFSGTGAATKAFKDRGHKVITVDSARNKWVQPDIQADIRYLPLRGLKPDFVWASPPCQDFTHCSAKVQLRHKAGGWPEAGMETYTAACDAIAQLGPTYWAIENVAGADKWWGQPTKKARAWHLWGRFPPFDVKLPTKYQLAGAKLGDRRKISATQLSKNYSRVPYALSLALCCAIERDLQ